MDHNAALIEQRRSLMRAAIKRGDMEQAGFYARIVVLAGDIDVKLRPVKAILAEQAAADTRRTDRARTKSNRKSSSG